jgi:predicted ester cyclase
MVKLRVNSFRILTQFSRKEKQTMNPAAIAKAALSAWEEGNPAKTAELLAEDFTLIGPAPVPLDKSAFLAFQQVHNEGFADWKFNPEVAEERDDYVRLDIQITATHTGVYDVSKLGLPVPPIPATGKRRQWPQESLTFTVKEGKISSIHAQVAPEGGIAGTLAWLGVELPEPAALSPREIGHRWAQLWNAGVDLAIIDEMVADDFVSHSAPPGLAPGREGVKQWVAIFHKAFPDIYSKVEEVIVEGDKVVERFSAGGTHQGEFFGIPPTGRRGSITGINILRIANGKVVEHWGNSDDLGMLQKLGIIPAPQAA